MRMSNDLGDIARKENWIDLGDALATAMETPEAYGLRTSDEVLQHVASLRGRKPHTLKNPLSSSQWLKERYPDEHRKRPSWLGMTLVMFLMNIEELAPQKAAELAPSVFAGRLKQVDLKAIYDGLREKRDSGLLEGKAPARATALRAKAFEDRVLRFLTEHPEAVLANEGFNVQSGRSVGPIAPDFLIETSDGRKVAVEVKTFRSRVDRSLMINTLAQLHLMQKLVPEILMIVPKESGYNLETLAQLRQALNIDGIRVATLPEEGDCGIDDFEVF